MAGSGVVLGYLKYVLGFDSLAFEQGLGDAGKQMKAAQRSLQKTAEKFTSIGTVMSVGITAPFTALVSSSIPAAKESQEALGQVQAALASMGDAAGRTLPQLQDNAKALMQLSTFDDDDILRKVTSNLLTFGNVSGEVFDRAQLAAINLSARLGQDLQSSAIQLGKALNDPIKGITALSRVGVSFTEQQKEQIKAMVAAGDTAGAQKMILAELERQYGGSAEALRKATPGIESQQAWADFQETVGAIALQVLPTLSKMLATVLNWFNGLSPATQSFVVGAAAITAGLGPLTLGLGGIISAFGTMLPLLTKVGPLLVGLGTVITGTVIPAIAAAGRALIGIAIAGGPLTLVVAGVAAAIAVWQNWDKIKPIVDRVVGYMASLYNGVKTWIMDKLSAVWDFVAKKIDWVKQKFFDLYDAVVGHSYIPDMVDEIGFHLSRLDGEMVDPIEGATERGAQAFSDMAQSAIGSLQSLAGAVKGGNFLDILQAGVGVYSNLASSGALGSKLKGVSLGQTGVSTSSQPGYLAPSRSNGRGSGSGARSNMVQVVPSPYFDVVVDGRAAGVAGSIFRTGSSASFKRDRQKLA